MTINLLTEKQLAELVSNPQQETIINNIFQLYQIIDYTNLFIKERDHTPDCERCGVCCDGVFDVSPIEAQVIQEALTTGFIPPGLFPPLPKNTLAHRLNLAREQLAAALQDNHFICPFYNHQVGCLIYKVRTVICRVFEVAVPNFDFVDEVKNELIGKTSGKSSGILCPNLKKTNKYPKTFAVWNLEALSNVLEQIYPGSTTYESRLLSFFKYKEKDFKLTGLPFKFKLNDFLKII